MLLRHLSFRLGHIAGARRALLRSQLDWSLNFSGTPDDFELSHLPPHVTVALPAVPLDGQLCWKVSVGDMVRKGEAICESYDDGNIMTSPADGILAWANKTESLVDGGSIDEIDVKDEYAPGAIIVPNSDDVAPFEWFSPCAEDTRELVYEGSFGSLIRRVKFISVTSCSLTLLTMPLLAIFGDESVPIAARAAIAGVVSFFGAGTTWTVNWICKPYIVHMWRNTQDHYTAETVNILGQRKFTNFVASDVVQGDNRPFSSFKLGTRGINLYVHKDDDCWRPEEHREFFYTRDND